MFIKHGHARDTGQSATYVSWENMKARCYRKAAPYYKDYGGCGIKVCRRWLKFENFLADMGERPKGLTLDRKDNDANYTPKNCRWATRSVQQRNRRGGYRLDGKPVLRSDVAASYGMTDASFIYRKKQGLPLSGNKLIAARLQKRAWYMKNSNGDYEPLIEWAQRNGLTYDKAHYLVTYKGLAAIHFGDIPASKRQAIIKRLAA